MADRWFFAWQEERLGPYSSAQFKELVALGRIQPTDTVWKNGIVDGVLAANVLNLFPAIQDYALPAELEETPLLRPIKNASSPGKVDMLDPWLNATPNRETPKNLLPEMIPDGLAVDDRSKRAAEVAHIITSVALLDHEVVAR